MKKMVFLFVALALVALAPVGLFADFDKKAVDNAMHTNLATLGALSKAVEANDYWVSAQSFYTFITNMKPLLKLDPPKGTKAEWDADINLLLDAALQGVGASLEKNSDKVKKALADLKAAQGKGHKAFRG